MESEKLKALSVATKGEVYDHEYNGGEWMYRAVQTAETIDQFVESSKNWKECTAPKFGEIAGMKFVVWTSMQASKGQQRGSLSVVDFGDHRMAISTDLTNY